MRLGLPAKAAGAAIMQKLLSGIHQFQRDVFASKQQLFQSLASGQQPLALFITCSDSRVDPNLITQTDPGELFVIRNAGNIVPPHNAGVGGEAATIEYAVDVLQVSDVIVCGHSQCGAMGGLLQPELVKDLPSVSEWLKFASETRRIIDENYAHLSELPARLTATVEENVLVQIEHLYTYPCVQQAIRERGLDVHAWVYKFETGQVFDYDATVQQFLPLSTDQVEAAVKVKE
jgi:carbonic anhydrase